MVPSSEDNLAPTLKKEGTGIGGRSKVLWSNIDPSNDDHAKRFLDSVYDNKKEASQTYTRAYYGILILAAIYWILNTSSISQFTFFSIEINDVETLKWVIPAIMSFLFYQGLLSVIHEVYLHRITDEFLKKHLPDVWRLDFEMFMDPPSLINYERLFSRSAVKGESGAVASAFIITGTLMLVPVFLIIYFICKNLFGLQSYPSIFQITATAISIIILVRNVSLPFSFINDDY